MIKAFEIIGPYPPATYISQNGKRYACSGSQHIEIPMNMLYPDIIAGWRDNNFTIDPSIKRGWEVPSAIEGEPPFLVRLINGHFDCHCFGYRKYTYCEHIQGVRQKLLLEKQKAKI